jgi:hypothetical protein
MGRHCGETHRQATHHAERVRTHQRTFASQLEAAVRIYLAVIVGTRYPRQPERGPREQVNGRHAFTFDAATEVGLDVDLNLVTIDI